MATHKSAEKRARASETKRLRNRQYIGAVRTSVKKFRAAITEGQNLETVQNLFREAQSMLSRAATKGLLHRNNAARRIGRLADALKAKASAGTSVPVAAPKKKAASAKAKSASGGKASAAKKSTASKAKPSAKKSK